MNNDVKNAMFRLQEKANGTMQDFRDAIIEELCRLTDSKIAYFYATDYSEDYLTLLGYSRSVMDSCQITERPAVYEVAATGLWGDAIRERRAIITNDYANSTRPSKHGTPEGHVPVTSHMNLPIFDEERIVALVGVGNKSGPYTLDDADKIEALMNAIWVDFQEALWAATW